MYVVQSGKINVFITSADGSTLSLKVVKTGDFVASLLSFTDVLTVSDFDLMFFRKSIWSELKCDANLCYFFRDMLNRIKQFLREQLKIRL